MTVPGTLGHTRSHFNRCIAYGYLKQAVRVIVRCQKRFDLGSKGCVSGAGSVKKRRTLGEGRLDCHGKEFFFG